MSSALFVASKRGAEPRGARIGDLPGMFRAEGSGKNLPSRQLHHGNFSAYESLPPHANTGGAGARPPPVSGAHVGESWPTSLKTTCE